MKLLIATLALMGVLMTSAAEVMAAGENSQTKADRATYNQLVRELQKTHRDLTNAWTKATTEARSNGGQASDVTKARVLSLRDSVDRKTTRLLLIALRHGWDVPDFSTEQNNDGTARKASTGKQELFAPVDEMVRSVLAVEAAEVASKIELPVITITGSTKTENQ